VDGVVDGVGVEGVDVSGCVARVWKDDFAVITDCDAATTALIGWSAEEMAGKRSLDFIHPADQQRAVESWVQMLEAPEGTHRVRLRHRCRDGSYVWMEITNRNRLAADGFVLAEMAEVAGAPTTGDGREADWVGPDRRSAATEIARVMRDQEWLLRRLAESLPTGVALAGAAGMIVYANTRIRELLGAPTAATVTELFEMVVGDDQPVLSAALDAVLVRGRDEDLELHVRAPDTASTSLCVVNMRALAEHPGVRTGVLFCVADVTESARLRAELERRATIDTLTGCRNRASTVAFLTDTLAGGGPAAAVFVDVNGLKAVNDELGHGAGDDLLAEIGSRLARSARSGDVVGRIGGDEFLLVCPAVSDPAAALAIARRAAEALEGPAQEGATPVRSGPLASIGVAHTATGGATPDELIAAADAAMYQAKGSGGCRPVVFEPHMRSRPIHPSSGRT